MLIFVALINDMILERKENYEMILLLWGLLFSLVYLGRAIITNRTLRSINRGKLYFNTLVVGRGSAAISFVDRLERINMAKGYHVVGYVSIPGENDVKDVDRAVFTFEDLPQVCEQYGIKEIIVVPTKQDSGQLLKAINRLFSLNLPIKVTPDKYNILLSRVRINNMYGDLLVDISSTSMGYSGRVIKRVFDVVVSSIVLTLFLPFGMIIGILIKKDSSGKVFYTQKRLGYHNKPFNIYKFRTMVSDAEKDGEPQLSKDNDVRITRIGRWLRKYRIDEIPQFWNVLKGDMSLVGSRPPTLDEYEQYESKHRARVSMMPGLTGLWQVSGRSNIKDFDEVVKLDMEYIDNSSFWLDVKIILLTVKVVLFGKGTE